MNSHRLDRIEDALIKDADVYLIPNEFLIGCTDNIHIGYTINQLGINTMDQIDISIATISVRSI